LRPDATSTLAQDDETKALATLLFHKFKTANLLEMFVGDSDFSNYFFDEYSACSHGFDLVLDLAKLHPDRRKLIALLVRSLSTADGVVFSFSAILA
jgi:hypothetical protein